MADNAPFASTVDNQTATVTPPSQVINGLQYIFSFFFRRANLGSSTPTPDIDSAVIQTFSSEKSCSGFNAILVKGESSNGTGTVAVRIWTKGASGVWKASEKRTPGNDGVQGGVGGAPATLETNYYHLAELYFDCIGATSYIIEQTGAPSDSAATSFWGDEV